MSGADESRSTEWARAHTLVQAVVSGDAKAFSRLAEQLWPLVIDLVLRSRALRGSATRTDDAHEIATRLLEKLAKDDFAALTSYQTWQQRHPDQDFADWMRIAAANALRDLMRNRRGSRTPGAAGEREPSVKQLLNEHALVLKDDAMWTRPPFTPMHTARQIMDYASVRLPPAQVSALEGWLSERTFDDIAQTQALVDGLEAKRLVRAAVATLRRAFAEDVDP